ncbi:MAG: hypothetical protein WBH82_02325 [Arcanobacterium sp.]
MKKKFLAIATALVMLTSLSACGSENSGEPSAAPIDVEASPQEIIDQVIEAQQPSNGVSYTMHYESNITFGDYHNLLINDISVQHNPYREFRTLISKDPATGDVYGNIEIFIYVDDGKTYYVARDAADPHGEWKKAIAEDSNGILPTVDQMLADKAPADLVLGMLDNPVVTEKDGEIVLTGTYSQGGNAQIANVTFMIDKATSLITRMESSSGEGEYTMTSFSEYSKYGETEVTIPQEVLDISISPDFPFEIFQIPETP